MTTYLSTYLPTYLPTYTNLPGYLRTYFKNIILPTYLPTNLPTYQPTYLHTYIPTYQPVHLSTNQHARTKTEQTWCFYIEVICGHSVMSGQVNYNTMGPTYNKGAAAKTPT